VSLRRPNQAFHATASLREAARERRRWTSLMRNAIVAVVMLTFFPSPLRADEKAHCTDTISAIMEALAFVGKSNTSLQLKNNGEVRAILIAAKQPDPKTSKWRLLERQGETLTYCVTAQGTGFEPLGSVHGGSPTMQYGLPGSGHPRCYSQRSGTAIPGSVEVRLWANKELGDSIVWLLPAESGNKDYTFLTSKDNTGYWILLDTTKGKLNETCYHSRGDASDIRFDYWPVRK
jgi:hypothetical protein